MHLNNIKPNFKKVKRYASVCDFNVDEQTLPITYPHILAFTLHLKLMMHERFPLPVMGLVHIRNTITAHRTMLLSESLGFHVFIGESRVTNKGIEFDIHSKVSINNEIVWESMTTNLYMIKKTTQATISSANNSFKQHKTKSPLRYHQRWPLPKNLGRKYALVSGNANPIHLHSLSAKLFGFKVYHCTRHVVEGTHDRLTQPAH
jgi:hypothetical protein